MDARDVIARAISEASLDWGDEEPDVWPLHTMQADAILAALRAAGMEVVGGAAADVVAERRRQIEAEGWTAGHDDEHNGGQMACAAACYAINSAVPLVGTVATARYWPWDMDWWKPSTPRRDLVKAAALIVAEIERIDRAMLAAAAKESSDG